MTAPRHHGGDEQAGSDAIEALRCAAPAEDDDGQPLGAMVGVDPRRPV
jgi:hypothetical protein